MISRSKLYCAILLIFVFVGYSSAAMGQEGTVDEIKLGTFYAKTWDSGDSRNTKIWEINTETRSTREVLVLDERTSLLAIEHLPESEMFLFQEAIETGVLFSPDALQIRTLKQGIDKIWVLDKERLLVLTGYEVCDYRAMSDPCFGYYEFLIVSRTSGEQTYLLRVPYHHVPPIIYRGRQMGCTLRM